MVKLPIKIRKNELVPLVSQTKASPSDFRELQTKEMHVQSLFGLLVKT
jgi:hypothetical protein